MFNYITKIYKEKSVAIGAKSPYVWFAWLLVAERFINIYGWEGEVVRALVRGFHGECDFLGKSPMPLDHLRG